MYGAKIVLDSMGPNGSRLITMEQIHPRMVHADFMTHRTLSRNASSSRAIPVEALLAKIESHPVIPVWWGKNTSGMQTKEEIVGPERAEAERLWLEGRDHAVALARKLGKLGLAKELANRVVEPWMFITCVVTFTERDNYFGLRIDGGAQAEIEYPVKLAREAIAQSEPQQLARGQWHLPYVTKHDEVDLRARGFTIDRLRSVSVGRCAAVSYLKQDSSKEALDDERRAMERLYPSGHFSPFEHVAQAMNTKDWTEYGATLAHRWIHDRIPTGNLWGWRQYRKDLQDEHDFSKIKARRSQ